MRSELEHQRTVEADLLHGRERSRPVDCALERDQMLVGPAPVVVQVAPKQVLGHASQSPPPGPPPCARARNPGRCRQVRSRTSSTKCTSDPDRESSLGITSTASVTPSGAASFSQRLDASPRARPGRCLQAPGSASRGRPRCTTSTRKGTRRAMNNACSASASAFARTAASVLASVSSSPQRPPSKRPPTGAWTLQSSSPAFSKPLSQVRGRHFAVVVEVRSRCDELHRLESVRRHVQQVLAAQPFIVEQMRRNAELRGCATSEVGS